MNTNTDYVLADLNALTVWNIYSTLEAAQANQDRANISEAQYKTGRTYKPVSYADYAAHERKHYLSRSFESFLMIEHWSGVYTAQYVSFQGRYFTKLVDATDKTTWLKAADLPAPAAKEA